MSNIKLYRHPLSGHSHRVELLLSLLGLKAELIDVDLMSGEQKQEAFLKLNPLGQVPVLVDGDIVLSDSNAILTYLAASYDESGSYLPIDAVQAAQVQSYLTIAASQIANGPGAARLINLFGATIDHQRAIDTANSILELINNKMASRDWLATDKPSLADVACYAYIARAPEGDISLAPYPHVETWLKRVEALPGFVAMTVSQVGLTA